jgi:hypothetical protein
MPQRARLFMIAYMTIGILSLLFTFQSVMNGWYFNAALTLGVFAFCSWQVYRLMQSREP